MTAAGCITHALEDARDQDGICQGTTIAEKFRLSSLKPMTCHNPVCLQNVHLSCDSVGLLRGQSWHNFFTLIS